MIFRNVIVQPKVVKQRLRAGMVSHHEQQASKWNGEKQHRVLWPAYNLNLAPPQASTEGLFQQTQAIKLIDRGTIRSPRARAPRRPSLLTSLEILRRVRETGYEGGKTALYALVASLRPQSAKPLVRFGGLPGEFSQHDFGQIEVQFVDGASQRVHFFASRLKYSRFMCVSLVPDEAVESLVRTLAEHLASWGGAPLQCVFDRPKTIALQWRKNGEVTEWNPVFAYATLEMGVGVELCWPYRAQQKGSVENLVGFVKSSFFKVRRFHDEEDLRQQLRVWHEEVNQERACRATGVIPAVRWAEEKSRLRPLKVQPEELALRIPVYVGPTATVLHDGHAYSMPPEAISMPATLYLYGQRVRIVAGRYEAMHPRKFVAHEGSSLAEHRAALVAAVSGKRGPALSETAT